jgi:hypothetical protein
MTSLAIHVPMLTVNAGWAHGFEGTSDRTIGASIVWLRIAELYRPNGNFGNDTARPVTRSGSVDKGVFEWQFRCAEPGNKTLTLSARRRRDDSSCWREQCP